MPASLWSEYKNSEGRTYWSHAETKQSVWEKPAELRTPFEEALAQTDWKQYTSKDRPYYVHSVTKETKWELPTELLELKRRLEDAAARGSPLPTASNLSPAPQGLALAPYVPPAPTPTPTVVPTGPKRELPPRWPVGGFLTHDRAEEAFMALLKYEGVDEVATWEDTMRKIITHELYKALETHAARKTAFMKYQRKLVEDKKAAKESRVAKMRPALRALFESGGEGGRVKAWMTIKSADEMFEGERAWKTAFADEREAVLLEYTQELREKEEREEKELRERNVAELASIIKQVEGINIATRWRQAHDLLVSSSLFKASEGLPLIDMVDMMGVYDDYMRELEAAHDEEARTYRQQRARAARKARDGFRALLSEFGAALPPVWADFYAKVKDDERYTALLGQPGSSPLDLWMDAIDDLDEETHRAADKLREVGTVALDTSFDTFEGWVRDKHLDNQVEAGLRRRVYDMLLERLRREAADETRRAERRRRHRMDDLRYALKSVQRHIDLEMSYEEALPFMKDLKEFEEVEEEQDRRAVFDKFIERQKEKLEDRARYDRRHDERDAKRPRVSGKDVEEGEI